MYHSAVAHLLKFFEYDHLPLKLQEVSMPFCILARDFADKHGREASSSPEVTVALRKLLEAKDAAVRSVL